MATGGVLEIDEKFLRQLQKADESLQKISDTANGTQKNVINWIQQISTDGIIPFYENLKKLESQYTTMSETFKGKKGFSEVSTQAKMAADAINQLTTSISQNVEFFNTRNNAYKKGYEERYSAYEKLFDEAIKKEQAADERRYNSWWNLKKQEEEQFKQVEARKVQAALETASKLEAEYQKTLSYRQQNAQAKSHSQQHQEAYREQLKQYERLFDEARKKEQDADAKRYHAWVSLKMQEADLQKRIDKEKEQSAMQTANRIAEAERKYRDDQEKSITAKKSSQSYAQEREKMLSEYERLFDQAIEREKQKDKEAKEQQLKVAAEAKARERKLDTERYEAWLLQKHAETRAHREAESAKLKATQESIVRQNEAYAKQAGLARKNRQVKENSENVKRNYSKQVDDYTKLFDEAIRRQEERKRKERKLAEEVARYEIEQEQKVFNRRRQAEADMRAIEQRNHKQRKREYEEMFRELDKQAKKESQMRAANYARIQRSGDTSKQATAGYNRLYSDKGVQSLNNMNKVLHQLQDAQGKLNLRTEEGKRKYDELQKKIKKVQEDINKATQANDKFKKSQSRLLNTTDQLQRKLALLFSVSAIQGYLNKLVEVRKELERQQKALAIIIQNKDEADKLWNQTIQLALKSPFQVKELITYTKQLAAYRIETDKLHDTTKRLADVSAGLGVDMQRLILAYGQIRAAKYLRGTELRQLTEAGIPMLEELATYLSEMEQRAISAGDVFEMISKRLVTFEDVEAVFRRMTDEGGVFYEMQEKQSNTLYGKISNLHDAIDLMLNDIGKSNDGLMKSGVDFARGVVDNWKEVAFSLEKVVLALTGAKFASLAYNLGIKKITTSTLWFNNALKAKIGTSIQDIRTLTWQEAKIFGVTRAQYAAAKATMYFQGALRGLWTMTKWTLLTVAIGFLLEFWRRATQASRAAEELKENLNAILVEDFVALEGKVENFTNLATRLGELNAGTLERKEIISKLNSEYGEFLNFTVTELTTTKQLIEAYDDVVKKMKEKAALQSFEKGVAAIEESYGNALKDAKEDFYDLFKGKSIKAYKYSDKEGIIPTKKEIDDIYALIQAKTGELKAEEFDSLQEQQDIIQGIVQDYYGKDFFLSRDVGQSIELMDILIDKKKKEEKLQESINTQYKEVLKSREANVELEKLQAEYAVKRKQQAEDSAKSEFERKKILQKLADEEQLGIIDIKLRFNLISPEEAEEQKNAIKNWATELTKSINSSIQNEVNAGGVFSEEELSKVLISRDMQKTQSISDYLKSIESSWKTQNEIISEQISLKSSGIKINEEELSRAVKLEELYRKTANVLGVELEKKESLSEESRIAINNLIEEEKHHITIEQAYKGVDSIISELKKKEGEYKNIIEQIYEQKKNGLPFDEERLRIAEEDYWWTKKKLDLLDKETKSPISAQQVTDINSKLQEKYQINAIDKKKDEATLLSEANSEKERAIAYEKQLQAMRKRGVTVTKEKISLAQEEVQQWTLRWKLLGGTEKTTKSGGRTNSLYDERIKVIDDMVKKYEELRKIFNEDEAIAGAFEAYKDAFADAYKDISWVDKNVKTMTPEQFVNKVLNFPDKNKIVEFLDTLSKEPMKAFEKIKVDLAKGEYVYEMNVDAKTDADDVLKQQIEGMFSDYELSLDLEKLNIPPDIAKSLFNVDTMSLKELRSQVEALRPQFVGTDMEKEYEEYLKKISEMEDKAQVERLKKYSKYLVKAEGERIRIKKEELRQIAEIEALPLSESEKQLAKQNLRKETQKQLDTVAWKEFQESSMYVQLFEDLEYTSTKALNIMRDKLVQMKSELKNLDPSDLKALYAQIEKLENELATRNPLKTVLSTDYLKAVSESKKLEKQLATIGVETTNNKEKEVKLTDEIATEEAKLEKMREQGGKYSARDINDQEAKVAFLKTQLVTVREILEKNGLLTTELEQQLDKHQATKKIFNKSVGEIGSKISAYSSALPAIAGNIEGVFGSMSAGAKDAIESISEIGSGIGTAMQGFASNNPLQVISGITQALSGFFGMGDKRRERDIKKEIEYVEQLQRSYEKLEKRVNALYNIDDVNINFKAMKDNLQEQIDSTEKMIDLEEDKKKTDHDRIKEWKKQIEDYQQQIKDLEDERINQLGGIAGGDAIYSTSQSFVDAWIEAFRETGDGLSGLEEQFDEVYMNLVKKQILGRGVDKMLKPLYSKLNGMLEDGAMTAQEFEDFSSTWDGLSPQISEFLTNVANDLGIADDITRKNGELSGLQEGISGITEDQADILAAYWSSVRFIVSSIEQKFTEYARQMLGTDLSANPILNELKAQTSLLDEINDKLGSIIGHSGGAHVKTYLIS